MPGTTITIVLPETELAALDRHRRDASPGLTREQALSEIVAAWAAAQPGAVRPPADEGMRPEQLNASNDM
ncbi:hypothetical protein ASE63_06310 [Bosea sp. Root381]|uniref:hypothetical protein n=1 Tax=Bosea sp. Root381 TaxID=1736524 RepID=UPI0006FCC73D|nr:hypothetical protein [Bosea sp. Root381]KRE05923.1 hypothetical protein ASE63_06310 [Bosea sp. Root381]